MAAHHLRLLTAAATAVSIAFSEASESALQAPGLRGATSKESNDAATAGGGEANLTAFGVWGHPSSRWASCQKYGCMQPYHWGQICGCWPGCTDWGICRPDYESTCSGDGELFTFWIYRAQSDASYPPKNVNAANLAGVMWYLQHEVVTETPPKFGITRILRYRVETRAPSKLLAQGMNFGVRYAYDSQKCTGPGDCATMYEKYGFFVGCNKFTSMYPFPTEPTSYPSGVWYSFPGEGNCNSPDGSSDCTYSYSWPPEEISLEELTAGSSNAFWDDSETSAAQKVQAAADLFKQKYPGSPNLSDPTCDFDYSRFWHN